MFYMNEFEIYEDEGVYLAVPFGMEGGTFGDDYTDAVASAADWLMETLKAGMVRGSVPEAWSLGNEPARGGKIATIAVEYDLAQADSVTAADAARMLGVSSARIAQMCQSGMLASWKDGARRMVSRESIEARLAEQPKAGRPRKAAMA